MIKTSGGIYFNKSVEGWTFLCCGGTNKIWHFFCGNGSLCEQCVWFAAVSHQCSRACTVSDFQRAPCFLPLPLPPSHTHTISPKIYLPLLLLLPSPEHLMSSGAFDTDRGKKREININSSCGWSEKGGRPEVQFEVTVKAEGGDSMSCLRNSPRLAEREKFPDEIHSCQGCCCCCCSCWWLFVETFFKLSCCLASNSYNWTLKGCV